MINRSMARKAVAFCAREVERQQDGPMSVYHMYKAWEYALVLAQAELMPTELQIRTLSMIVRDLDDVPGYRQTQCSFPDGSLATHWDNVPRLMAQLHVLSEKMTAEFTIEEYTHEFLRIHPFEDGNGRVAALLYNIGCGTITDPVELPEFAFT